MGRLYLKQIIIVLKVPDSGTDQRIQARIREQAEALVRKLEEELKVVIVAAASSEQGGDGTLWLTDCERTAGQLLDAQLPVMVWLHEGNRQCHFPNIRYAVEEPQEPDIDFYDKIYRRYSGIPWEIAETERCIIRETTVEDVDSFVKIYREPGITKYTDAFCTEPQREREYVKEYIEKVYEFFGYGVWTVLWKETGEVIGRVGFEQPATEGLRGAGGVDENGGVNGDGSVNENREEKSEEFLMLGYMIAGPWQGRGIAQEVCRAALAFARLELGVEKVQVVIDAENHPSLKLAERLGFQGWHVMPRKECKCLKGMLEL